VEVDNFYTARKNQNINCVKFKMNTLLGKFRPIDVIAVIVITGGLILKFCGFDGTVGSILTVVVLFYFGQDIAVRSAMKDVTIKKL